MYIFIYSSASWDSDQRALNVEQLHDRDALSEILATIPFAYSLSNFIFQLQEVSKPLWKWHRHVFVIYTICNIYKVYACQKICYEVFFRKRLRRNTHLIVEA